MLNSTVVLKLFDCFALSVLICAHLWQKLSSLMTSPNPVDAVGIKLLVGTDDGD